jgi:putative ABC transport system ATP-binding protein
MLGEELFEGTPDEIPHLRGDITLKNVTLRNSDGNSVLENISLDIPAGSRVALKATNQVERRAIGELLTREVLPLRGSITIAGHDLSELHQAVIAARIGYATARPYLFDGTLGDNLLMSLKSGPKTVLWDPNHKDKKSVEAERSGNSLDSLDAEWIDPGLAGLNTADEINGWWFQLVEAMGVDEIMFRRMLGARLDPDLHPAVAAAIVGLRTEVNEALKERGLASVVNRFDPETFNPSIPLGGNLMFASPIKNISQEGLVAEQKFLSMIVEEGLAEQGIAISQTLIETLHQTFGMDGTNHPLFTALGIEEELYERLVDIANRRAQKGDQALSEEEFALLLTVPFAFTAEQIGPGFPESFKREILEIRKAKGTEIREKAKDLFIPVDPENYLPRLTLLENALYGRISGMAGVQGELVEDVVAEIIAEHGMKRQVAETILDVKTGIGGTNLPGIFQERAAFSRAGIKRPDILILDTVLASHDSESRKKTRSKLQDLLPDTTLIFLESHFENPQAYDLFVEIKDGRIDGTEAAETLEDAETGSDDLRRKIKVISRTELFANLDSRSQRLLAFSAQWFDAPKGKKIFSMGEKADAAYLCLSGRAILRYTDDEGQQLDVTEVNPGRLIGDLSIILDEPRQMNLVALEDTRFLRIGASEFRAVIENDPKVAMSLLQTVASHLTGAAELLREARVDIRRESAAAGRES